MNPSRKPCPKHVADGKGCSHAHQDNVPLFAGQCILLQKSVCNKCPGFCAWYAFLLHEFDLLPERTLTGEAMPKRKSKSLQPRDPNIAHKLCQVHPHPAR